jgi:hypothetical protein
LFNQAKIADSVRRIFIHQFNIIQINLVSTAKK